MTNQELVTDLLTRLANAGWTIHAIDDGREEEMYYATTETAVKVVFAVAEAEVYLKHSKGLRIQCLFFVTDLDGIEVLADHTIDDPEFEAIIDRWVYDHEEDS